MPGIEQLGPEASIKTKVFFCLSLKLLNGKYDRQVLVSYRVKHEFKCVYVCMLVPV